MRRTIVAAFILVCAAFSGSHPSYGQKRTREIETVGIGVPDPAITNQTQRLGTARDAALAEAQARMLSILQGRTSGEPGDPEKLKAGILQGASVVKTEWSPDGRCHVTLRFKDPE